MRHKASYHTDQSKPTQPTSKDLKGRKFNQATKQSAWRLKEETSHNEWVQLPKKRVFEQKDDYRVPTDEQTPQTSYEVPFRQEEGSSPRNNEEIFKEGPTFSDGAVATNASHGVPSIDEPSARDTYQLPDSALKVNPSEIDREAIIESVSLREISKELTKTDDDYLLFDA